MRNWRGQPAAAALLLCAIGVAGCTGPSISAPSSASTPSSVSAPSSAPSSAPHSTPSPTPTVPWPRGVPAGARSHTNAGAIAYARYYIAQINATGRHPKRRVLESLALARCAQCANFAGTTEYLLSQRQHLRGDTFVVERVSVTSSNADSTALAVAARQPPAQVLDRSGQPVRRFKAAKGTLLLTVVWSRGRWWLASIALK